MSRECVRAGAEGSRTRRSSGDHLLNPQNFLPDFITVLIKVPRKKFEFLRVKTNHAECERCFSCLKRVKTYLKNALSQKRLNHMMILNIFEKETEELNLAEVANDFSCECDKRKEDFGYRQFV